MKRNNNILAKYFYYIKPIMPRKMQIFFRKYIANKQRKKYSDVWPINNNIITSTEELECWPEGKKFSVVLRHDIESVVGLNNLHKVIEIEQKYNLRSSFNFSPERYKIPDGLIWEIKRKGFEVGLHGLRHDGKLYSSRKEFLKRAYRINSYMEKWDLKGFVSPSSHHNFEWLCDLNILYDSSSFDTDPFEPQPDSVGKIFPFIYNSKNSQKKYIELPYTLPQDSTLFIVFSENNIDIWKNKIDWIVKNNGMVLLNTHPDYMSFDDKYKRGISYPSNFYESVLEYLNTKYKNEFINFLPFEIAEFWLKYKKL